MPLNERCPANWDRDREESRPRKIHRHNFEFLDHDAHQLIVKWFDRAEDALDEDKEGYPFESFIYAWIAVNGWAACCTGTDTDAAQVTAMAADTFLQKKFNDLLKDTVYRRWAAKFHDQWPIFKAAELRRPPRLHPLYNSGRRAVVDYYLGARPETKRAPRCYERHKREGKDCPLDWEHTVWAIYLVRCNLFHGEKSAHSEGDRAIVTAAANTLVPFFNRVIKENR
jgi:hypothetical protein